jgi:hypothetical protein
MLARTTPLTFEIPSLPGYMVDINPNLSTTDLMKLAADYHQKRLELTPGEKELLITTLKERGRNELEYGEELEVENVRLIRRVTGAVGVYFA